MTTWYNCATLANIDIVPPTKEDCITDILHYSKVYTKYTKFERFFYGKDCLEKIRYWTKILMELEEKEQNKLKS